MPSSLNILLVSRKAEVLDSLEKVLLDGGIAAPRRKLVINGHVDPLHGVDPMPDLLILHVSHLWQEELEMFMARHPHQRPALIVVGASTSAELMRMAMRAGARDLLNNPLITADLLDAVQRVANERPLTAVPKRDAQITAFINAKGGCGATLLAVNVAHILVEKSRQKVALFDLDMQFGTAPLYLDLFPQRGIAQALENLRSLDEVALQGYFSRHASGLDVISHGIEQGMVTREVSASELNQLLDLALLKHDHLVLDLPRRIDTVTVTAMQRADRIVLVLQQSVTALRDAAKLTAWLRNDLGLVKEQLRIVVNRHDKSAPVSIDDIRKTLGNDDVVLIPNDYQAVSACINSGTPLLNYARKATITRAIVALESKLGGRAAESGGGLGQALTSLFGGRAVK